MNYARLFPNLAVPFCTPTSNAWDFKWLDTTEATQLVKNPPAMQDTLV